MSPLFFLLLPALASSNVIINVHTFEDHSHPVFTFEGSILNSVSDKELLTFQLPNEIVAEHSGKLRKLPFYDYRYRPANEFELTNKDSDWTGVERALAPSRRITICNDAEDHVVSVTEITGDARANFDWKTWKGRAENTFHTKWLTRSEAFDVSENEELVLSIKGASNLQYTFPWGVTSSNFTHTNFKASDDAADFFLEAGQDVVATMYSKKVTLKFTVEYTAQLYGFYAGLWHETTMAKGTWAPNIAYMPIENLIELAGVPETVKTAHMFMITYHTGGKIVVTDKTTGSKLIEFSSVVVD